MSQLDSSTISTPSIPPERQPLLRSDLHLLPKSSHPHPQQPFKPSFISTTRHRTAHFLTSKTGHYSVLALVSLDVAGIFADFLISLHVCEHGGEKGFDAAAWERASSVLGALSLVFSCLFMLELGLSLWAFGLR